MVGTDKYEYYQIHFVMTQKLDGVSSDDVVQAHNEKYPRARRGKIKLGGVKYIWSERKKYAACSVSLVGSSRLIDASGRSYRGPNLMAVGLR